MNNMQSKQIGSRQSYFWTRRLSLGYYKEGKVFCSRGDRPFQVLEKINDNAYKWDLPGEYDNISVTFNVVDLSLFDVGNI